MSKKSRERKKQDGLPENLLCNKSDEELIVIVIGIQDGINSGVFTAYDIILKDTIIDTLEDRGYVVSETLLIQHASELESDSQWGKKKEKGEDEEDKEPTKETKESKEPGKGTDYKHLEDPDWPEN